ncbi:MAG: N-acetyltransferase [Bacteroidetes bacterium]|nr:N-acetyltransferase [Bacteroidota bacterium]
MIRICQLTKLELDRMLPLFLEQTRGFEYNNWTRENFLSDLPDKWLLSIFAESDRKTAGFSINSHKEDALHIHYFFVFKEYRKLFLGNKMLDHCVKIAKENDLSRLTLKCNFENYKAVNFYFRNGFHIEDMIPDKKLYLMVRNIG